MIHRQSQLLIIIKVQLYSFYLTQIHQDQHHKLFPNHRYCLDKKFYDAVDRRYNIVVYGIEESSSKLSIANRTQSDLEKVVSILPNINSSSIKDLHCLGKFKIAQERPSPIIMQFLCALDTKAVSVV